MKGVGGGDPSLMSGLRGVAGFLECWTGPSIWGLTLLQHDSHYRFSLGARLGGCGEEATEGISLG